jgi:hypothetical protein
MDVGIASTTATTVLVVVVLHRSSRKQLVIVVVLHRSSRKQLVIVDWRLGLSKQLVVVVVVFNGEHSKQLIDRRPWKQQQQLHRDKRAFLRLGDGTVRWKADGHGGERDTRRSGLLCGAVGRREHNGHGRIQRRISKQHRGDVDLRAQWK